MWDNIRKPATAKHFTQFEVHDVDSKIVYGWHWEQGQSYMFVSYEDPFGDTWEQYDKLFNGGTSNE